VSAVRAPVAAPGRDGRWLEDPGFGVYVHIPFCKHRCHYCDFNTYEGRDDLHDAYVDALVAEIRAWSGARPATSVFFGGGTPMLLPARQLARVLDAVRVAVGVERNAEVTAEANPETVDRAYFEELRAAGFNRVSIGVQSLVPRVLLGLGRTHSPERALDALGAARAAGFDDVNADLIYGSPWETGEDWECSLRGVLDARPDHVSAYALTIEEGTPLSTLIRTGRVPDVDPDVQAERHEVASAILSGHGYERYEVSNWARPNRASRHNVLYWSAGDYLGFGAGAHAHVAGRRSWTVRLPRDYITAAGASHPTEAGAEELSADERAGEALMLGLRLRGGVDVGAFARRFGPGPLSLRAGIIADLVDRGLLERSGPTLRLAPSATLVANEALCRLL
jgi:putative oxygen-independent coproporphyrinogen III oxidase